MRRILAASLLSLSLALAVSPAQAQEFSSLEERMSARDFREAGLDKLSPEELARLNAWLAANGLATAATATTAAPPAPQADRRGLRDASDTADIVARIQGPFRGWQGGETELVLDNGQVWKVLDPNNRLHVGEVDSPAVRITTGALGAWWLQVEGSNRRAQVQRLR